MRHILLLLAYHITENIYKSRAVSEISRTKISPPSPRASFPRHLLTLNTYVAPPPPPPPPFTWVLFTIGPLCSWQIRSSMLLDCGEGEREMSAHQRIAFMDVSCEKAERLPKPQLLRVGGFSIIMASKYRADTSRCTQEPRGRDQRCLFKTIPVRFGYLVISCLHACKSVWLL